MLEKLIENGTKDPPVIVMVAVVRSDRSGIVASSGLGSGMGKALSFANNTSSRRFASERRLAGWRATEIPPIAALVYCQNEYKIHVKKTYFMLIKQNSRTSKQHIN